MSPTSNAQFQAWLRQALQDPTQRPAIMQAIREAGVDSTQSPLPAQSDPTNGTTPGFGHTLSQVGNAMSRATPQTAGATGAGALLGVGLGALLKRRNMNQRQPGTNPTVPIMPPDETPPTGANPPSSIAGSSPNPAGQLTMGVDAQGNTIHSTNGQDWVNDQTGAPATGSVYQQTQIMRRGGRVKKTFADGGRAAEDVPPPVEKSPRAVLMRHAPIPVLHTTIVIAAHPKDDGKKKAEKKKPARKARGGSIKPRKPAAVPPARAAVPPARGPEPYAPFKRGGRVQVPRGSGAAVRGRKFGGIY